MLSHRARVSGHARGARKGRVRSAPADGPLTRAWAGVCGNRSCGHPPDRRSSGALAWDSLNRDACLASGAILCGLPFAHDAQRPSPRPRLERTITTWVAEHGRPPKPYAFQPATARTHHRPRRLWPTVRGATLSKRWAWLTETQGIFVCNDSP
jgi:hypothetical protein